ncbi:hypothetical protein FNF28_02227 [Cafeteria roenbergensis]|uniref:Uncharacterized protein n=1 Tax=Cafeteria roenbergensis TaxID=33653 RepID=A0A5A8DV03_CAFRO|nr:hypothetical protein FNF28_02227 [Cafeteria roenbergensis]
MRRFVAFHQSRIHAEVRAVKTRFIEVAVYIVFCLAVVFSSVVNRQDQDYYWLGAGIKRQLMQEEFPREQTDWVKTFTDIENVEDIWVWATGPLYTTLYDSDSTFWGSFAPNNAAATASSRRGILFGSSVLLGGVRVSQLRSAPRPAECVSFAFMDSAMRVQCLAHDSELFTTDDETQEPAGTGGEYPWAGSNLSLTQSSVENERSYAVSAAFRSSSGRSYPAPAYSVILPHSNATEAAAILEGLWRHGYIDEQTRVFAVSFTVYNPNIDLYTMFDAVIELTKVGTITVGVETTTARLGTVWESRDTTTLVLEVVVILFYCYYTFIELRRTFTLGFRRLQRFSAIAHDLNIFTYITYWTFKLLAAVSVPDGVVVDSDEFFDFRLAIRLREIARLSLSCTVFIVFFKLLAYSAIIPSFGLLTRTIGNAVGPTVTFLLISALMLYSFSASYMIALGPRAFHYRNLATSATTLLRALLGDFDYEEIRTGHFLVGPILFILFVFLGVVVLLNVVIAIVSAAWDAATSDVDVADDARIARLFAQHAWAVVSGVPFIGSALQTCQQRRREAKEEWVSRTARAVTELPVSRMLKLQPWQRIRRAATGSRKGNAADFMAGAISGFDFREHKLHEAASPLVRDEKSDGAAAAAAGKRDGTAGTMGEAAATLSGEGDPTGCDWWVAPAPGLSSKARHFPGVYRRAAAAVMSTGLDKIKHGDGLDPTRASGPYATPLALEINTRIALKRQLLGKNVYRDLVRQRVQESVEALIRDSWHHVAARVRTVDASQVEMYANSDLASARGEDAPWYAHQMAPGGGGLWPFGTYQLRQRRPSGASSSLPLAERPGSAHPDWVPSEPLPVPVPGAAGEGASAKVQPWREEPAQ